VPGCELAFVQVFIWQPSVETLHAGVPVWRACFFQGFVGVVFGRPALAKWD
jgi:hypothetical protein